MKRLLTLLLLLVPLAFCVAQEEDETEAELLPAAAGKVEPYDLRIEHLGTPQGIDEQKPRFSWKLQSEEQGQLQSAYRIVVYRTQRTTSLLSQPVETVWDTGKVNGRVEGRAQFVEYGGKPLQPKSEYTWVLTVWDKPVELVDDNAKIAKETKPLIIGKASDDAVSTFSTGIWATDADKNPWKGKWIGLDKFSLEEQDGDKSGLSLDGAVWIWTTEGGEKSAPVGKACFRKTFELSDSKIVKAEIAFTADNGFTGFLNEKKVADGSSFKTAKVFDVSDALQSGKNVLAFEVVNHGDAPNPAGLIGTLRIEYADAKIVEIKTDASWLATDGTPEGFRRFSADESSWKPAIKIADYGKGPWGEISVSTGRKSPPARYLAKTFSVKEAPISAKAYITGLGYYELRLNGEKIGNHVLDPVLTDYDKRVPYVTYDIDPNLLWSVTKTPGRTDLILGESSVPTLKTSFAVRTTASKETKGFNVLQIVLGNGRYFAPRLTDPTTTRTFGFPKVLFQLDLQYKDGSTETICSDEQWAISTDGPIRDNNDYDGEIFDARKDPSLIRVDANAQVVEAPKGKLVAQMMPPMRIVEEFTPISVTEVRPGVWVFDFGVNLVGNCKLKLPHSANNSVIPTGTAITIRHAETLQHEGPDKGMLYVANLRGAKCRDIYLAGSGQVVASTSGTPIWIGETYTPTFSYHGFRYAELTGLPEGIKPDKSTLTALAINTDLPKVGKFETSNETINAVFRCIQRGTQGNYLSIPTDCPQRDERQGWQGDRAAESKGEMFLFDNVTLYSKWLNDIQDSQRDDGNLSDVCPNYWPFYRPNVTWPSAFTIVPDSILSMYGDRRPIERHYDAMKCWLIGHMGPFVKDGIIDKDNYGDWCVPPEKPELIHSQDPARKTSKALLATAYYIYNLDLLTKYAKMLNKPDDAVDFARKAAEMKRKFNAKFLNTETGKYDNGTQTSCVLPLYFGIVPDGEQEKVFKTLVDNIENVTKMHIGTGLIGGQWLNRVLSDNGRPDISYRFATNTDYPSWGYMVKNGATTIWELWNGNTADPAMNSGNHVMLVGDLGIWYYENLAGIKADPEKPGFEHIVMKPTLVDGLDFVNAEYDSVRGPIKSSWKRNGNSFHWEIEIPVGSTATVTIPGGDTKIVPSGKHVFDSTL